INNGIKEIITEFPKSADILTEYDIGCVPCTVGTCLLKDIVEIHDLTPEKEQELMFRIEKAIFPHKEIKMPKIVAPTRQKTPKEIKYSPPVKKLVDEHVIIKKWLALIPQVIETADIETEAGKKLILDGVDFIRSYADRFHHAKEEDILFKYCDENSDIIKVIHEDHETARSHVMATLEALDNNDRAAIAEHLTAYRELLTEHIKKEDEILYPWIDRGLVTHQVGELFSKFSEVDKSFGNDFTDKYEKLIQNAEKMLQQQTSRL
ncbi:MAG: hemerythrin domain-containing protein, partial [bacterium]